MGYIDRELLPNEQVVARTTRHKIVLVLPILICILFLVAAVATVVAKVPVGFTVATAAIAVVVAGVAWISYSSAEFAVTTFRLVLKQGWVSRRTIELQLNKVEALNVDQTIMGRILGYGTLRVIGTGGTTEVFSLVSHPAKFRTAVQAQIATIFERPGIITATTAAAPREPRAERTCPYCAERILAAAKVCRFCNRDVTPTAA
jgi:uncharacterized membrane protein YdbT with pleckstrin-like domain